MYSGLAQKAAEISIFPENAVIPPRVLAELWTMEEFDVEEEALRPLHDLSLLRWDREAGAIQLHAMIRRSLGKRLTDPVTVHRKLIDAWADPYRLPHHYAWRWFGWHSVQANEGFKLRRLLLDFDWLRAKLEATDINALLSELDYVHDDQRVALVRSALRASAHILAKRPAELATQLIGRLPNADRVDLQEFVAKLRSNAPRPWLRPLAASLAAPGLLRVILADPHPRLYKVAVSSDSTRIVSVDDDYTQTVWDVGKGVPLRRENWNCGRITALSKGQINLSSSRLNLSKVQ